MARGQLLTTATDLERIASAARHSMEVQPRAVDRSAARDLLSLSRFMTAVSSTLDPEGVCAAAAREWYDLAPYQQIVFRLDALPEEKIISFSPGIRQAAWTEDHRDEVELVLAVPQLNEWRGSRQVVALPHGLGSMEIVPVAAVGGTLAEPLRSSLLACLATALLNAIEHSRVKELAMVDGLTGLLNRRVFDEMLSLDGRKELLPLSLLLIDLDDFKQVNDRFGHQAGDEVLTSVGRMLKDSCRGTDIIARYGGEEFAVLLPTTQLVTAAEIGRRLLQLLGSKIFVFGDRPCRVTASIGAATLAKASSIAVDQLIARADQALYEAKRNGKNRVVLAERTPSKGTPAQQAGQESLPGF